MWYTVEAETSCAFDRQRFALAGSPIAENAVGTLLVGRGDLMPARRRQRPRRTAPLRAAPPGRGLEPPRGGGPSRLTDVDRGGTAPTATSAGSSPRPRLGRSVSPADEPRRETDADLAVNIEGSSSESPVNTVLRTDERVLARVTDGIYRQPGSAIRELVSNAYDADAKQVVIKTDRPRFHTLSVEDDGMGMTPAALAHLLHHIGGSAKRSPEGADLGIASTADPTRSPLQGAGSSGRSESASSQSPS